MSGATSGASSGPACRFRSCGLRSRYILPPHRHARACPAHPRLTLFAGGLKDVDGRLKPGHDGADVARGTDLPDVSSPATKNISLFRLVETAIERVLSRAHKRGVSRSSRALGAGCDGRFGCARRAPREADGEVVWS
jgi:hypothetical protein